MELLSFFDSANVFILALIVVLFVISTAVRKFSTEGSWANRNPIAATILIAVGFALLASIV